MLTFSQYLIEQKVRKYVAVQYDDATQKRLRKWAQQNDFDLTAKFDGSTQQASAFDFHTTIFFSTSSHDMKNETIKIKRFEVKPVKLELLGENNDIPVIKVESNALRDLRSFYEKEHQMKDQWPEYKPHISLSYSRTNLPDISKIELPKFKLIVDVLKIADAAKL